MNILELNENVCRICLDSKVYLNWNDELFDFCGMTYKSCYYHYTQLDETDADPFSTMLCKTCSEELKQTHFLIEKAVESFRILQQTYDGADYLIDEELKDSSNTTTIQRPKEIEIVANETQIEHDNYIKEFSELKDSATEPDPINVIETYLNNIDDIPNSLLGEEDSIIKEKVDNKLKYETSTKRKNSKRKLSNEPDELNTKDQSSISTPKTFKSGRSKKFMCAYCSLKAADIYQLRKHEETHDQNRERTEVCPHCGLKFYSKLSLKSHIEIHKENREKTYKCEFCDKAYFNRGGLNIHRRIHLGLMIKCSLCPKEFCRQIDLDRHMSQHSTIPTIPCKISKYVVNCKDCNTQIPIRRWKSHKATHKNEPEVKCKICNKDFFSRKNCVKHIKNIHNKTKDEYEMHIHYYVEKSKARMSHLMLQQFETVQPVENFDKINSL